MQDKIEPTASEQAAWHAGLDEGRAQKSCLVQIQEPAVNQQLTTEQEPVWGQSRFAGDQWGKCSVEHVRMVLAAPHEWPDYEVRYLYAAPVLAAQLTGSVSNASSEAVPDEREAFEQYMRGANLNRTQFDDYVNDYVDGKWEAWQARAALAATPAAAPAGWKLVPMEPTAEMLERAGEADRDGTPATYKTLYMAMVGASPAAAPVVLPEPDAYLLTNGEHRGVSLEYRGPMGLAAGTTQQALYTVNAVRALLATATGLPAQAPMQCVGCNSCGAAYDIDGYQAGFTDGKGHCPECPGVDHAAPQAQAVERGEVLVTVSGFTGSGKSAIAGEIEIMCRALGLQVEWPDSDSEKHMTHADWIAALEQYKPRVRIVECNVPHSVVKGQDK